ncbi:MULTISPECIES: hypothetical protein [Bacillus]|uniref:hypothetical protein n=1 Tax=Bacillus TaxID=1386 RepID=UPI000D312009
MSYNGSDENLKVSPNFNFIDDVGSAKPLEHNVDGQKVIVPVRQYSKEGFVEMKTNSFRSLLDSLNDKIKKNWDSYEKEKRQTQLLNTKLLNKQAEIEMLKTRLKAYEKFENQQGKGRPKVLSGEELAIAYKHLKSYKEKTGRYNYSRTFRYMQENYAYEGSHVTLINSLREKHPEILDKPSQINTGQNKRSKPLLTDEMLEIAYKYRVKNSRIAEDGKRKYPNTMKINEYLKINHGYYGGVEQLKERLSVKIREQKGVQKMDPASLAVQKLFQEKLKGDK